MKKVMIYLLVIVVLLVSAVWLCPRSFADVGQNAQSVVVRFVANTLEHDVVTYEFDAEDPMFSEILQVLNRYSYHLCLRSFLDTGHISDNKAGYWFMLDFYSEPDKQGELREITMGGTGEVLVDAGIYHVGYWGNSKQLDMMEAFYALLMPDLRKEGATQ